MKEIFMNEKPVMALVAIRRQKEAYGTQISKSIDTTYSHTVKILARLEEEGLIRTEKEGRKKIIQLTDEGKKYSEAFIDLLEIFEENSDPDSMGSDLGKTSLDDNKEFSS